MLHQMHQDQVLTLLLLYHYQKWLQLIRRTH
nr:MAG TPA: hypothetical protein [Bacteriophage sp.]